MSLISRSGSCVGAALLVLLFVLSGGCGTGTYNDRLEQRIQELKSATPASSEEETDGEGSTGQDEQPQEDEAPEDDVPEINEPL